MAQSLWKTSSCSLLNLNILQPGDAAILLAYIFPREMSVCIHQKAGQRLLFAALVMIPPNWKEYKYPTIEECRSQLWDSHEMDYYAAVERRD